MNLRQTTNCALIVTVPLLALSLARSADGQAKGEQAVVEKARSLESRGLTDLAAQTWRQVLLSEPDNTEALAGLARTAKKQGNEAEAARYLARLRQLSPKDPQIAVIESTASNKSQNARKAQAEALAAAGNYAAAMDVYRQLYGAHPPEYVALQYYDTEAATKEGRAHSIAGLRELAKLHPAEARYSAALGRVLTYDPKTRAEGEAILEHWPQDAAAQGALRQALQWDGENPEAAGAIQRYLKLHSDQELSDRLKETEKRQAQEPAGPPANPGERAAYQALQANDVDRAERGFRALLDEQPDNARALEGMGFVHMKQSDFARAVTDFEAAQQHGLKDPKIGNALDTAHFWLTMGEATKALEQDRLEVAVQLYREALARRPASPEALAGLAGTLLRDHQATEAALVYARLVKVQPDSAPAWRGLFVAQSQSGQPQQALATARQLPGAVERTLATDPEYLMDLAAAYRATGDDAKAGQTLDRALNLPFPDGGRGMPASLRLQYGGVFVAAKHYEQAAGLYRQVVAEQPDNAAAWQGLILAQHLMHDEAGAMETAERMPRTAYDAARRDPGFLSVIAAAYQQEGHLEEAQRLLEEAASVLGPEGKTPTGIELQIAAIERQRNHPQRADTIYRQVLDTDGESAEAWNGWLGTLHQLGEDSQALVALASMPARVQTELAGNEDYLLTLSAIYSATGNSRGALAALSSLRARYAAQHRPMPAGVEIQSSWLLLHAGDEGDLYPTLMRLGGRKDLTDAERGQIQAIWAEWSVRRAAAAVNAGNTRRALTILNTAKEALAGNEEVSRSLAGGYLTAGDAPSALAIYQSLKLSSAEDYRGAIGSALAAKNLKLAEDWLRQALKLYPRDARILGLAARFEQARGDNGRARDYWKASLAVSPDTGAADRLAGALQAPVAVSRGKGTLPPPNALAALLGPASVGARPAILLPGESETASKADPAPAPTRDDVSGANLPPAGEGHSGAKGGERLGDYRPQPESPQSNLDALPPAGALAAPEHEVARDASSSTADVGPGDGPTMLYASAVDATGLAGASPVASLDASSGRSTAGAQGQQEVSQPQGLTDQQLLDANLVPLRRSYVRAELSPSLSARQEAQQQIASIDGGFSPWMGGTGDVHHRSGTPGFDQLTALEAPFEASVPLQTAARLTVITTPVFLDAGVADGTSTLNFGSAPVGTIQPQQDADGVANELQLTAINFAARVGDTPYGFLVSNIIGGVRWRPAGGPLTFNFSRESVKDTQLSYSGLRDPGSATATFDGNIWGGVIANGGDVQIARGAALSGFYASAGGQYITGNHVQTNTRLQGNAGAYWRVLTLPDLGRLVLGANFFGMHYAHNLRYFTYGQGGYFSPEAYFLAGMPLSWTGHYGANLHYTVTGSIGAQSFQEDSEPYFPLDSRLQAAFGNPLTPVRASVGANYDLQSEIAYRIQDHWYVGGFLDFNNTRDYESQSGGFFVRYLFRPQPDSETDSVGIFPHDGFRPTKVP